MIGSQWEDVISRIDIPNNEIQIVDYGCGQSLASALFLDAFKKNGSGGVSKFVLIDPSSVSLHRARRIAKCYYPNAAITMINKRFDNLVDADIRLRRNSEKIHLFSNVLDLDGFSVKTLADRVLDQEGIQHIIGVSHDRDFHGGSGRVREFYSAITSPVAGNRCEVLYKDIGSFKCNGDMSAIYFSIRLESYGSIH